MTIYENMQVMAQALASDPETKDRYEKARRGSKEWLCFSRWIAEDRTRWNDSDAVAYRDSLTSWLGSIDIVYVLQFETDAEIVNYLKDNLVAALERETTKKRLHLRSTILERGLHKPWDGPAGVKTTSQAAAQYGGGSGMICRFYSAMKGYADYLRGNAPGPSFWTHPDCQLYLKWYNKYDAPTSGLYRVQ
jgi:hypothetical protein